MQNIVYLRQIIYIYCEHYVKHVNILCSKKRRSLMLQQVAQAPDQAMGVLTRCGGVLTVGGTTGPLLVEATLLCSCTQTEDIQDFEERVMSYYTVRMLSAWVVATLDSRRNFAHAHVSHSLQGSSRGLWTTRAFIARL